ncbi:DUF6344 domain-containing protein [Streptomyces sp. NPDC053493]|uniref:DUF6344 domain-containing protein n=1 Tax=Streptomyces sp. NPDC053493 TaxID=3365705 RepID=UPI0037D4456B
MATAKVKQIWTAFVSVLFALFASLGLASPATAAAAPALRQGEEPAAAGAPEAIAARPAVSVPAQRSAPRWNAARDRALPPTIKQRISAEAHGSSPSVRHLRADAPAALDAPADLTGPALTTKTAATTAGAGEAVGATKAAQAV